MAGADEREGGEGELFGHFLCFWVGLGALGQTTAGAGERWKREERAIWAGPTLDPCVSPAWGASPHLQVLITT